MQSENLHSGSSGLSFLDKSETLGDTYLLYLMASHLIGLEKCSVWVVALGNMWFAGAWASEYLKWLVPMSKGMTDYIL